MFSQQSIVNYHQSTEQAIWTRQRVGNIDLPHLLENTASLFGLSELTSHVEHAFDDGADHSGITENNKFKAIAGNESDVFACHCFRGRARLHRLLADRSCVVARSALVFLPPS